MGCVNKVILVGRLGKDPEIRHTNGGDSVATFSLATSESWKDRGGDKQEKTEWHNIVAWRKLADLANEYLRKGQQLYIEGKLQTREWEDRDGGKRRTTEIVASLCFWDLVETAEVGVKRSRNRKTTTAGKGFRFSGHKVCKLCGFAKPLEEFYRHPLMPDGRLNHCKECRKAYERDRRAAHGDYVRKRDRRAYLKNRKARINSHRKYRAQHPEIVRAAKDQWGKRNRHKTRAQSVLHIAVKAGKVQPARCKFCGISYVEGHHPDYSKPLDVRWLCARHHAAIHRLERMLERGEIEAA